MRREGREGKGGRPAVTKVFLGAWRVRGRGSICCSLRGHCSAGERPVAVVCAALAFQACGWIFIWAGGAGQRGSITVGVGRHTRSSRRALITSVSLGCRVAISA